MTKANRKISPVTSLTPPLSTTKSYYVNHIKSLLNLMKSHEVPKVLVLFSAPCALPRLASGVGSGGWMADCLEGRGPAELCSAPGAGAMAAVTNWGYPRVPNGFIRALLTNNHVFVDR